LSADGVFGQNTLAAVETFQNIFNLPPTGIVNFATWYKISNVYVAVTRIGELR
jgi:peptidoglycan hydrolase-like protein with peptidoglycan-binding domain